MERQCAPVSRVNGLNDKLIQLNDLHVGKTGRVTGVFGEQELRRRLLEMGFCNGARVEVIRRAPMGDPIEYRLRGYHLSLRAEQAKSIRIHPD